MRRLVLLSTLLALLAPLSVSDAWAKRGSGARRPFSKVILVSIDTLRADFLTPYNPTLETTPFMQDIASRGTTFSDVITQGSSTIPSHHATLSGIYPWVHGIVVGNDIRNRSVGSPLKLLQASGVKTAAFVGGGKMNTRFGFGAGFDEYVAIERDGDNLEAERIPWLREQSFKWLASHHEDDFFLLLHTYKVHCPYNPPESYARKHVEEYTGGYACKQEQVPYKPVDLKRVRGLYAAEVEYVDAFLGQLTQHLKDLGIWNETMIVITSDHGELLGEHYQMGHNNFYEDCLRVPLIIRAPGIDTRKVDGPAQLIDVMPSIFSALGVEHPPYFHGIDLLPVMRGERALDPDRVRFSSSDLHVIVYQNRWKAIFATEGKYYPRLFDLEADPNEKRNLYEKRVAEFKTMRAHWDRLMDDNRELAQALRPAPDGEDGGETEIDEELLEELRALGYVE